MRARLLCAAALAAVLVSCTSAAPPQSPTSSPSSIASAPSSASASGPTPSPGAPAWLTFNRDPARTGFDPSSPVLGSPRLTWASADLDGAVYAQPLVLDGRVLVVTENDSAYALDAATGRVMWRTHLGEPVPRSALPCGNIDPTGITGTPVVDPSTGLMYAVAFVQPGRHQLVAIDTETGRVWFRRPADPPGVDPLVHQQRAALIISSGRVYGAFGGLFGDCGQYHGLVVGVALDGSGPLLAYAVPSEGEAGIWAPSGPALDSDGNLVVATGNSSSMGTFDFGNSVIRLSPDLRAIDWFAASNWIALNQGDTDLGSVGPAILPGGLVFQIGKEGIGYLLRLSDLGGIGGEAFSGPVCSGGAFGGVAVAPPFVYVPCTDGVVGLRLGSGPSFSVAWTGPGFSAGPPIVAGGAVWSVDIGGGSLVALDTHTGRHLFDAAIGAVTHFASPSAAAGRLYVAAETRVMAFSGV